MGERRHGGELGRGGTGIDGAFRFVDGVAGIAGRGGDEPAAASEHEPLESGDRSWSFDMSDAVELARAVQSTREGRRRLSRMTVHQRFQHWILVLAFIALGRRTHGLEQTGLTWFLTVLWPLAFAWVVRYGLFAMGAPDQV